MIANWYQDKKMMLKNLLKSSVSVVVVLGILSTLNPSQAGNSNGSISRLPEDEKTRSLKSSKKKIKIKNKEPEGVEIIDLSLGYNLLREDENILKLMLMQRGIDFDTLMSTRLVSKTSYTRKLVTDANQAAKAS